MASVDFQKQHGATDVKRRLRHMYEETRLEDNHSNPHIDKGRTASNSVIYGAANYQEACKAYDDTIAYLDSKPKANKRKDRVTGFGLAVPIPPAITETGVEKEDEFARAVIGQCRDLWKQSKIICSVVHRDEIHDYLDAETGEQRRSRAHIHIMYIPIADDKLAGKKFSQRNNMFAINKKVESVAKAYGTFFMTGEKRKSTLSMGELKNRSSIREAEAAAKQAQREAEKKKALADKALKEAEELRERARRAAEEAEKKSNEIDFEAELKMLFREDELEEREQELKQREQKMQKLIAYGRRYEAELRRQDLMSGEEEEAYVSIV